MHQKVKAKKHLGQHFLNDELIAQQIVSALVEKCNTPAVLEIGPGMGVLTKYLLQNKAFITYALDVDTESIAYLKSHFPELEQTLFEKDFLACNLPELIPTDFCLIGNFPYNISSQIVFKLLENKKHIPMMVGMFQKEVAERLAAGPRTKAYGILSVLTQAFYEVEYLITVPEHVFTPPPQVKSGVVRLIRKNDEIGTDVGQFFKVVKTAFNQRRKKLRNALQIFQVNDSILQPSGFADKRAEELTLEDFVQLTNLIALHGKNNS